MKNEFKSVMENKSDKELLDVIESMDKYQSAAIEAAEKEIERRGGLEKLKNKYPRIQTIDDDNSNNANTKTGRVIEIIIVVIVAAAIKGYFYMENQDDQEIIDDLKKIEVDYENFELKVKEGEVLENQEVRELVESIEEFMIQVNNLASELENDLNEVGILYIDTLEDLKDLNKLNELISNLQKAKKLVLSYMEEYQKLMIVYINDITPILEEWDISKQEIDDSSIGAKEFEEITDVITNYYDTNIQYYTFVVNHNNSITVEAETVLLEDDDLLNEYNDLVEKSNAAEEDLLNAMAKLENIAAESFKDFEEAISNE